jgi:hypothetical protein
MKARRSGVLLVATGLACLAGAALPLLPATADSTPGSGLGSFSLAANAPVVQFREDDGGNCAGKPANVGGCEGVINETVSTLRNGPVGYALSSVGWPGTLAGNLGSLMIVAGGDDVPQEATMLNSPVRAENTISGKDDTVRNESVPGASMTATATADRVEATAAIGSAQATPLGSFGQISSRTSTQLTGVSTAEAVAHSEVQQIDIAGVLKIKAVVSDARATTDGVRAVPSGKTTVVGATVGGVPVTIDERGVTVQGNNLAFPSQVTDGVQSALKQAGITLALSSPIGKADGANVVYNAGALIVFWQQQPNQSMALEIGGAQVSVASSPGYDLGGGPVVGPQPQPEPVDKPVDTVVPPAFTDGGTTPALGFIDTPAPATAGEQPIAAVPVAQRMALPSGLSPWYGVLAALGSLLVLAGLRRLPDRVLAVPATACPLGDNA